MSTDITIISRDLSPFEQLVLGLLCEGKTNSAIAAETSHTEKVIENTVSRAAKAFNIKSDGDTNTRVLLALAFRTHFGNWELSASTLKWTLMADQFAIVMINP
jgi:DNA-binding NarL/FixJ family response regulator